MSVLLAIASSERHRGRSAVLLQRSYYANRRSWGGLATGFLEPLFYLFTLGAGLGTVVGKVYSADGMAISYAAFIAPALLASTTMNAAFYDLSVGFFFRLRHARLYEAVLATPTGVIDIVLGEALWTSIQGTLYASAFLAAMYAVGVTTSFWALIAIPAAFLVAFTFGLLAMAGATFIRSWSDVQLVQLVTVPMLLFATTFYPINVYPESSRPIIEILPLYQANVLMRSIVAGEWTASAVFAFAYLVALAGIGGVVSVSRLDRYFRE